MTDTVTPTRRPRRFIRIFIAVAMALVLLVPLSALMTNYFSSSGTPVTRIDTGYSSPALPGGRMPGADVSSNSVGWFGHSGSGGSEQLSYNGSLSLQAEKPAETIERATQLVRNQGGSVSSININSGDAESANATFRVRSDLLTPTLNELSKMGVVSDKSLSAQDLGPTAEGIGAQIATTQAEIDRITANMANATPSMKTYLESQLEQARQRLSSLQQQAVSVNNSVTYSTLHVVISTDAISFSDRNGLSAFGYALSKGWDATAMVALTLFSLLGFAIPLALILILAVLAAAGIYQLFRRIMGVARPLFR